MKLIIAGGRDIALTVNEIAEDLNNSLPNWKTDLTEIVSGGAKGVDASGEKFAKSVGLPIKRFKADWNKHGKAAGPIRNKQMAEYGDLLLLCWDEKSKGSASMKREAEKAGLRIMEMIRRRVV